VFSPHVTGGTRLAQTLDMPSSSKTSRSLRRRLPVAVTTLFLVFINACDSASDADVGASVDAAADAATGDGSARPVDASIPGPSADGGVLVDAAFADAGSTDAGDSGSLGDAGRDGPLRGEVNLHPHEVGNAGAGEAIFRFETFGNENFWTDVVQLPQGIAAAELTPLQALRAGYNVNIDALDEDTQVLLAEQLATDLSPEEAPALHDPAVTIALINANAVIGVVAVDSNEDEVIDVLNGDKVGVSCAFCHAVTDGSAFSSLNGGSIGVEIDGPTPHFLNLGATFALAANTRALYPLSQVALTANGGASIGRAPTGLTETSTEAEFDAYFGNPEFYPIGMFDDQPDGTGAPMHITPMFRSDLSAPYGSEGAISKLDNFSNLVYTVLFDLRNLTTEGGRAFMNTLGGAAGDEIVDDYVAILTATGVDATPAIEIETTGDPGTETTPIGLRVDNTKLLDLSAYMDSLPAPEGVNADAAAIARGRELFRETCTSCHNVDQSTFVPSMIVPMEEIFPGDDPVRLAEREVPLSPVLNTVDDIFDDKMVIVNASIRGDIRGIALPLLLDLARKPVFLHDNSVPNLDSLLNPSRGENRPHPFYVADEEERADMITFLKSLDTTD
jgi:cytochrome c2